MKAIVPVAGEGTRLRPHTLTWPKCLIPVGGKAILDHILDALEPADVDEAVLITGYLEERVRDHVARRTRGPRCTCVRQEEQLGLGHAVLQAAPHFDGEPAVIIYGDTLFDTDLAAAAALGHSAIGVHEVEHPDAFGVVYLDDAGRVRQLVEKPQGLDRGLIIVGVNVIRETKAMFDCLRTRFEEGRTGAKGEFQLTDAFQDMVDRGILFTTFDVPAWFDCGNRRSLLATNRHVLEAGGDAAPRLPGCVVIPPVRVADGARAERCVLGPNVTVGEHAVVENAVLADTIVNPGAHVSGVVLRQSIIGRHAVVSARAHVADVGDYASLVLCGEEPAGGDG